MCRLSSVFSWTTYVHVYMYICKCIHTHIRTYVHTYLHVYNIHQVFIWREEGQPLSLMESYPHPSPPPTLKIVGQYNSYMFTYAHTYVRKWMPRLSLSSPVSFFCVNCFRHLLGTIQNIHTYSTSPNVCGRLEYVCCPRKA